MTATTMTMITTRTTRLARQGRRRRRRRVLRRRKTAATSLYVLIVTCLQYHKLLFLFLFVVSSLTVVVVNAQTATSTTTATTTATNTDAFANLNRLLEQVVVSLPDMPNSSSGSIDLDLYQIECQNLRLGDMTLTTSSSSSSSSSFRQATDAVAGRYSYSVQVDIMALDMICRARYRYRGPLGISSGTGDAVLYSWGNSATTTATFLTSSSGGETSPPPPTQVQIDSCTPNVVISDLDFSNGGLIGWVLDTIEGLLRSNLQQLAQRQICLELEAALRQVEVVLESVDDRLEPYYKDKDSQNHNNDPLTLEQEMMLQQQQQQQQPPQSASPNLVHWQDATTSTGQWMRRALQQGVAYANAGVFNPLLGRNELRINQLARQFIVSSNGGEDDGGGDKYSIGGALVLDPQRLLPSNGPNNNGVSLWEGHDLLTQTTIVLDGLKLVGLDSLTRFDPLEAIGNYTLQNAMQWDYLAVQADTTVTIRPSTLPGSVIVESGNAFVDPVVEQVQIYFGLDDLLIDAALLAAVDQDALEAMELGQVLVQDNLIHCALSIVQRLELATLSLDATNILTPSLNGLVDSGLDRVVTAAVQAAFDMYEEVLLEAAPAYLQRDVRPLLNQYLADDFLGTRGGGGGGGDAAAAVCPALDVSDRNGYVDFRDLLLPPNEAIDRGGSGSEPYGDVVSTMIMPSVRDQLQAETFNDQWVRSFTKEQSGVEGTLQFWDVFSFHLNSSDSPSSSLYDEVKFDIASVTISNLDTLVDPMQLLDPINGNEIVNSLAFASDLPDRFLNVTMRVALTVDGNDSPLAMKNEVEFSISAPSSSLTVGFLANLREQAFFGFPLNDATNVYCWIAALDKEAVAVTGGSDGQLLSLIISTLTFTIPSFFLGATCISASSPGCYAIPEVLGQVVKAGFQDEFQQSLVGVVQDIMAYMWNEKVEQLAQEVPRYCPHSEAYDPQIRAPVQESPISSGLSSDSIETLLALGIIGFYSTTVVAAKNQLMLESLGLSIGAANPQPESEFTKSFSADDSIIDWSDLSSHFGPWADNAFEEVRAYLSTPSNGGTRPRINELLREQLLGENGILRFEMEEMPLSAFGFSASLVEIQILGLDAISEIVPFVAVDPYTLQTILLIDKMSITAVFTVDTLFGTSDKMELMYTVRDVSLQLDTKVAVNVTKLGLLQLGSMFEFQNIVNCIMACVEAVEISKLEVVTSELSPPIVQGFFSANYEESISSIVLALHEEYRGEIIRSIPSMFDSTVRQMANVILDDEMKSLGGGCPLPPTFAERGLIDFRELLLSEADSGQLGGSGSSSYGDTFRWLYAMLEEEIMKTGASNRPVLNDLLSDVTFEQSGTSGMVLVAGNAFDSQSTIQLAGLTADIGIQVKNVRVQNLDSIGDPLNVLRPTMEEPNVLNNTFSFGVDSKPISFEGTFVLSVTDGVEMNIHNEVNVTILVEDVTFQATLLAEILENAVAQFPFHDFSKWQCWVATILPSNIGDGFSGIRLLSQSYSIGNFTVDVACNNCSSPDFDELITTLYAPEKITSAIEEQANSLMGGGFATTTLNNLVLESKKQCPHRPEYDPDFVSQMNEESLLSGDAFWFEEPGSNGKPMYFNIANTIIASFLILFGVWGKVMVARRNRKWIESLSPAGDYFLRRQLSKQQEMEDWLDANATSLFKSPFIPRHVRWGVPIAILVNIGLYLGGHLGVLSVINLDVAVAGESFTINNFMVFSFLDSTKTTYNNGGAEMVILIWIFTGIWPYVKLLMSLVVWMMPPKYLGVTRRGTVLLWIDALAKLSVIDVFTLILGLAILLVFIGGPDESIMSDSVYYALKAIVVPKAGCYCIIIAQRMSRVSSQFFLDYHEKVVKEVSRLGRLQISSVSITQLGTDPSTQGSDCESGAIANNDDHEELPSIRLTDLDREVSSSGGSCNGSTVRNSARTIFRNESTSTERSRDEQSRLQLSHSMVSSSSSSTSTWRHYGTLGVILGGVTILMIFIIGCVFAPAISFDLSTLGGLAVESGKTYYEAVSEYGVFVVISGILVNARFVLNDRVDYIGFGLLLAAAAISMSCIFFVKSYRFIQRKLRERMLQRTSPEKADPTYGHKGCGLPDYFRLYKWRHMEIYLISITIGVWQLGSIVSYTIHLYCNIMGRIYDIMTYLGLVEPTSGECYQLQASSAGNLIIIIGSFLILLTAFFFQASAQYKKNIKDSMKYIDKGDVPRLSLAWSQNKSQNTVYSHLTDALSSDWTSSSSLQLSSPGTSPFRSSRSHRSVGGASTTIPPSSPPPSPPQSLPRSPSRNLSLQGFLSPVFPVSSPSRSRNVEGHFDSDDDDNNSGIIDAPCVPVTSSSSSPSSSPSSCLRSSYDQGDAEVPSIPRPIMAAGRVVSSSSSSTRAPSVRFTMSGEFSNSSSDDESESSNRHHHHGDDDDPPTRHHVEGENDDDDGATATTDQSFFQRWTTLRPITSWIYHPPAGRPSPSILRLSPPTRIFSTTTTTASSVDDNSANNDGNDNVVLA